MLEKCKKWVIVCLFAALAVFAQQEQKPIPELQVLQGLLQEERVLNQSLAAEKRRLEAELAAKEAELNQLRSRYAQLLVTSDRQVTRLGELEVAAAHLLGEEPGVTDDKSAAEYQFLQVFAVVRRRLTALANALEDHGNGVAALMDACKASQSLRQQMELSLSVLKRGVDDALQPVALAAEQPHRGGASASVVKSDPATGIVVLDQGFLNGVQPGVVFKQNRDGKTIARFKVIQSRPLHSAAVLESGDGRGALPGVLLLREVLPAGG